MTSLIYGSVTKMDNIENKGTHGQSPEQKLDENIKSIENIPHNNLIAPQEQIESKKLIIQII